MAIKKKIRNKNLPKFNHGGGDLFGMGSSLDRRDETFVNQDEMSHGDSEGSNAGSIVGAVGNSLGAISKFIPQDNDRYGISQKGQKISSGIQTGLDTAGDIASQIPGVGGIVGGALKIGSFLTKGITAMVDAIKEKRNPKDEKWNQEFNAVNPNGSMLNFGIPQGKFGMPLYGLGGVPYNQADIEAEQGEAMLGPDNNIKNIEGQKHEQGGTPLALNGNEQYIYSDRLGYTKDGIPTVNIKDVSKSFADKAKTIERKYSKKKDPIAERTKEMELGKLTQDAEQTRQVKEQVDMKKKVKKFAMGGNPYQQYKFDPENPNPILQTEQMKWANDANFYQGPNDFMSKIPYKNWAQQPIPNNIPQGLINGPVESEFVIPSQSQINQSVTDNSSPSTNQNSSLGATDNSTNSERSGLFKNLTTGDKLQLAGMVPGSLYNFAMGLKKSEKEGFHANPYQNEVIGLMQNRRFDTQPFINEAQLANTAMNENIANNSSSVGVQMANMQKAHVNYMNSIAGITGRGQEVNNNYRAEEANVKSQLGEVLRQEGIRVSGVNAQNKAAKQAFMAKGVTQIGQGINAVGQASNQSLTNTILAKSLSEISPDFDIKKLKDLYDRNQVDKDGYFYYNGGKFQYVPDQNRVIPVVSDVNLPADKKTSYPALKFNFTTSTEKTHKGK